MLPYPTDCRSISWHYLLQPTNNFSVEEREGSYAKLVNAYYELATLFYEWGWGSSFHFASRWRNESFQDSIKVSREGFEGIDERVREA